MPLILKHEKPAIVSKSMLKLKKAFEFITNEPKFAFEFNHLLKMISLLDIEKL